MSKISLKNRGVGQSLDSPLRLPYMQQIRNYLSIIGTWPGHQYIIFRKLRFPLNTLIALTWIAIFLTKLVYFRRHCTSMPVLDLGQYCITLCMYLLAVQCFATPWNKNYSKCIGHFIQSMHLYHYKNQSDYAYKVYKKLDRICKTVTYSVIIQVYLGEILFNTYSIYNTYKQGLLDFDHRPNDTIILFSELPITANNYYQYALLSIANFVITYICYDAFCMLCLLLCVITIHTYGHLEILNSNLENIPLPNDNKDYYFDDEEKLIARVLKDNIIHHRKITRFISLTSKAFGRLVLAYYAFHLYTGCILLLECSTLDIDIIGKFGSITIILIQQQLQISVIFELMQSKSDRVIDSVYGIPWQYMGTCNRRIVLIFLTNVQKPLTLKALGMVPIGVRTMVSILKTCFSYFLMLRTFATSI